MKRTFTVGDKVVERVPHYALGTGVVVVGEVVGTDGPDYLVVGLRLPDHDPAEPAAWDDPFLFGADELRRFRPGVDKPYRLARLDLGSLRKLEDAKRMIRIGSSTRRDRLQPNDRLGSSG